MSFSLKALGSALFTMLICLPAVAQTRYCLGGDLDHLSAAERASCNAARDMVKTTATRLHAPENWHFVIVCGEQGWKDYTAVAQREEVALENSAADTDLDQHVTYLRQSRLGETQTQPQLPELQSVLIHELASIKLGSHDERLIEAQVATWHETLNAKGDSGIAAGYRHDTRPTSLGLGA